MKTDHYPTSLEVEALIEQWAATNPSNEHAHAIEDPLIASATAWNAAEYALLEYRRTQNRRDIIGLIAFGFELGRLWERQKEATE